MTTTSDQHSVDGDQDNTIEWSRVIGLLIMHLGCIGVIWVGWSWTAVIVAFLLYLVRAFAITGFYHRYFSHRAFKTSRWFQFVGALTGCMALQKGPLWWAAHHRTHHRESDQPRDIHSPRKDGFWWAHVGWLFVKRNSGTDTSLIPDWMKFPELRWIDRNALLIGVGLAVMLYGAGALLNAFVPQLNTTGPMLLFWGFFISTVILYHVTYSVNSITHMFGRQRFKTTDDSRNSFLVSLFTMGEGWHNNHHHYQSSARQGFFWWEVDFTFYFLIALSKVGLVWDLRPVPEKALAKNRIDS